MSKKNKKIKNDKKTLEIIDQQKALLFFKNLNFVQRKYVSDFAEMKQIEYQRYLLEHIDCVLTATAGFKFEELSLEEINQLGIDFTNLFEEHIETKKWEIGKGRDEIMKKRKDLEPKIIEMCERLLEEGKTQKDSIEELKFKFNSISKSELINCYKRTKEMKEITKEMKKVEVIECEDPDVKEGLEKIFENEKNVQFEVKKNVKEEIKRAIIKEKVVKIAEKEAVTTRQDEVKEIVEKVSNLRIIKHEIIAEGIFGQYTKNENGVRHGVTTWRTVDDLRKKTTEEIDKKRRTIEELEKQIDYISGVALEAEDVFNV